MPETNESLLDAAIGRNAAAVISLPSAGIMRNHKTRFLGLTQDGFYVEATSPEDNALIDNVITAGSMVGVAFKSGFTSVLFATSIVQRIPNFQVSPTVAVEALQCVYPNHFRQQQRRQSYRVTLPIDHHIGCKVSRIPEHVLIGDRPQPSCEIHSSIVDLSISGLGLRCPLDRDKKPVKAILHERLRICLTYQNAELIVEGRTVHRRDLETGITILGIQFKKLEKDLEGRQALAKLTDIVGFLQREEVKRLRQSA